MAWTVNTWTPSGDMVIRAEPSNELQTGLGTNWGWTYRFLERLISRNHSWTIRVRRHQDDPFGLVLYSETVEKRRDVPGAIKRIEIALRGGTSPEGLANP